MRKFSIGTLAACALLATALGAGPAFAGNIVLTGHDNDYHAQSDGLVGSAPSDAIVASLTFVRAGSSLPVLTFDSGTQLTTVLTANGIAFTNIDPNNAAAITDALFNSSIYSAIAVASESSCGGCDNSAAGVANITAHSAAIASFFNAGGGIYGLAGASDPNAYAYVPTAATNAGGSPPASGYVQTAAGATYGIPAVNGDPTHNFFGEPGSAGLSASFSVFERLGDPATGTPETIGLAGGTIGGGGITVGGGGTAVPEPASMALLGTGLLAMGFIRRRKAA